MERWGFPTPVHGLFTSVPVDINHSNIYPNAKMCTGTQNLRYSPYRNKARSHWVFPPFHFNLMSKSRSSSPGPKNASWGL